MTPEERAQLIEHGRVSLTVEQLESMVAQAKTLLPNVTEDEATRAAIVASRNGGLLDPSKIKEALEAHRKTLSGPDGRKYHCK